MIELLIMKKLELILILGRLRTISQMNLICKVLKNIG